MRVDQFDFVLPESCIALQPIEPRDAARLLVVQPDNALRDAIVRDLPSFLRPGDAVVMNDTRVIAAALEGVRIRAGGEAKVAFNLIKRVDERRWRAFARPGKRLQVGDHIRLMSRTGARLDAGLSWKGEGGEVELRFDLAGSDLDRAIDAVGETPLPPYIALKREATGVDATRYQTVFARAPGAVAAPTAGLHMTPELLCAMQVAGASLHYLTLHVGAGTFLPVKAGDTRDHVMHSEWGEISAETAAALNQVKVNGGRIFAIGTTALRLMESAAGEAGALQPFSGETAIFITPGYRFRAVDVLVTNFHLPRSTLFMLVSAFAGLDAMRAAYAHAIQHGYRFYSYGDGSILFRATP